MWRNQPAILPFFWFFSTLTKNELVLMKVPVKKSFGHFELWLETSSLAYKQWDTKRHKYTHIQIYSHIHDYVNELSMKAGCVAMETTGPLAEEMDTGREEGRRNFKHLLHLLSEIQSLLQPDWEKSGGSEGWGWGVWIENRRAPTLAGAPVTTNLSGASCPSYLLHLSFIPLSSSSL